MGRILLAYSRRCAGAAVRLPFINNISPIVPFRWYDCVFLCYFYGQGFVCKTKLAVFTLVVFYVSVFCASHVFGFMKCDILVLTVYINWCEVYSKLYFAPVISARVNIFILEIIPKTCYCFIGKGKGKRICQKCCFFSIIISMPYVIIIIYGIGSLPVIEPHSLRSQILIDGDADLCSQGHIICDPAFVFAVY